MNLHANKWSCAAVFKDWFQSWFQYSFIYNITLLSQFYCFYFMHFISYFIISFLFEQAGQHWILQNFNFSFRISQIKSMKSIFCIFAILLNMDLKSWIWTQQKKRKNHDTAAPPSFLYYKGRHFSLYVSIVYTIPCLTWLLDHCCAAYSIWAWDLCVLT